MKKSRGPEVTSGGGLQLSVVQPRAAGRCWLSEALKQGREGPEA